MTCPEIVEKIPYEVRDDQVRDELNEGYDLDVFSFVGEPGTNRYKFNEAEFNEAQIREINRRALTRMTSPAEEWGEISTLDEIPDEFFYKYDRHEVEKQEIVPHYVIFTEESKGVGYRNKVEHANSAKSKSRFLGGIAEPWNIE
jgi:hypothetical protein